MTLAERRKNEHCRGAVSCNFARRVEAIATGHLDVEDAHLGLMLACQFHRFIAATRFSHDDIALVFEHLAQIEPDDGLVLCDHDSLGHTRSPRGTGSLGRQVLPGCCGSASLPLHFGGLPGDSCRLRVPGAGVEPARP